MFANACSHKMAGGKNNEKKKKTEKITIGSIGMFCSFCSTWGKLCYDKYSGSRNQ